jgi:7-cyano-7-deazaguanine synthase
MTTTHGFVLLSGGVDSTTALAFALNQLDKKNVRCISIDYGQRHFKELHHAKMVADYYGLPHTTLKVPNVPKTLLTDPTQEVPNISYAEITGVSPSYVPFRNGLMLSNLAAHAIGELEKGSREDDAIIYFGAHSEDAAGDAYPDCNFQFTGAMANAIFIGTYYRIKLIVPWQFATKDEIIRYGARYDVPYHLTWSCYAGGEKHCSYCPTCRARKEAFKRAGVKDPTEYADHPIKEVIS